MILLRTTITIIFIIIVLCFIGFIMKKKLIIKTATLITIILITFYIIFFIYSVIKSDIEYRSRLANISYTIKNNKTKKDIEDKNTQLMLEFKYIQNKSHLTNLKCI